MKLRLVLALLVLRHPFRVARAWAIRRGWARTRDTYYCPGCGERTRRWPKVLAHACDPNRAGRRRIERAAKRKGTVRV